MSGSLKNPNETASTCDSAALQHRAGVGSHSGDVQVVCIHAVIMLGVCHSTLQQLSHRLASGLGGLAQVCGSGLNVLTPDHVAKQLDRHYVGIELNPEYTELAVARIGGEI